jgi:phenylacetate-CoA ligase
MTFKLLKVMRSIGRGQQPRIDDLQKVLRFLVNQSIEGNTSVIQSFVQILKNNSQANKDSIEHKALEIRNIKFLNTVKYVNEYVPFYKRQFSEHGINLNKIQSLADINKLPFTFKEDIDRNSENFISHLPGLNIITPIYSSGTSGQPIKLYLTDSEVRRYTLLGAIKGILNGFSGPNKIEQIHYPLDLSPTGLLSSMSARLAGSLILTIGMTGTLDDHIQSLIKLRKLPFKSRVTTLEACPPHLWALLYKSEEMGISSQDLSLEHVFTGGAMVSDDLKNMMKRLWGINPHEHYGLTELLSFSASSCSEDRLHFNDLSGYFEVLDPQTRTPVQPGQSGVLVATTFYPDRELMPVLRYWTNDLVRLSPAKDCPCGQNLNHTVDILGRADQMISLGLNFYPQEIGDSLLKINQIVFPPRFKVKLEEREKTQNIIIEIEVKSALKTAEQNSLVEQIKKQIVFSKFWLTQIGAVELEIKLRPKDSIKAPFPYKYIGLTVRK